jgi:hypothetical protein
MTDNMFADDHGNTDTSQQASLFDQNKGEGGEPLTEDDIARLKKSHYNAQNHIKTLESETAKMRDELESLREQANQAKAIDDVLEEIRNRNSYSENDTTHQSTIDPDEIVERVKGQLTKEQQLQEQSVNAAKVLSQLESMYGENYTSKVQETANDLGMDLAYMDNLAKTAPNAFLKLFDKDAVKTPAPTQGTTNPPLNASETQATAQHLASLKADPARRKELMDFLKTPQYRQYVSQLNG